MKEQDAIAMLAALSQETRLHVVRYLVERGADGAAAGKIGTRVGASSSRMSVHLSALENAGLVTSERQSRSIVYRADLDRLGGLVSFILNDCCGGHPDILACCGAGSNC